MKLLQRGLVLLFFFQLTSCGEPVETVLGDWIWVESSGGLLPPVTPENSGKTARLNLSRNYWTFYEDGQQTERFEIKFRRRSEGLIIDSSDPNGDKIIKFINADEITVSYYGGRNTDCQDCGVMRFVRGTSD